VSWRDQRGMTLVEVLVAMTITSIVLLGISSALFVGFRAANMWGQKLTEAQTVNQLPGRLDQDLHRYVPCGPAVSGELDLCLPSDTLSANGPVTPRVRYTTSAGLCPCTISRTGPTGAVSVVTRDLISKPTYQRSCSPASSGGVTDGWIVVSNLVYQPSAQAPAPSLGPPSLRLDFRAPHGSC